MPDLYVGIGTLTISYAVNKVLDVQEVVIRTSARLPRDSLLTISGLSLDPLCLGMNLPSPAIYDQHRGVSMELDAMIAGFGAAADGCGVFPEQAEIRK